MDEIAKLELEFDTGSAEQGANKTTQLLDNVGAHAESMGSAMSKAVESVKNGLQFLGLGFGLFKATEALQDAIQLASRYQALGVIMTQLGTQAGYTSRQLNSFTSSLQQNGLSMNESRQGIVNLIQANIDLSNANKLSTVAQNASVIANVSASDAYQRLIFGIESGNSRMLKSMGLLVDFNGAYDRFAAQIGKHSGDLDEDQQMQAKVNEVMRAGITIVGAQSSALNTADEQMRILSDSAEDLKNRFGALFQPAYTAIIFTFAHAIEAASNNIGLIAASMAAFGIRALAPSISNLIAFTRAQVAMRASMIEGNSVILGSTIATQMQAKASAEAAVEAMNLAVANESTAAAAALSAANTAAAAAANDALAAAEAASATATQAATVATEELNAAFMMSPLALITIGVIALGVVWDALTHKMESAAEITSKYGDDLSKLDPQLQSATAKAQAFADAHGKGPVTKQGKDVQADLEKARKAREETASSALDFSGFKSEAVQNEADAIVKLNSEYDKGDIKVGAYATQLEAIGEKYKDLTDVTNNIILALDGEGEASKELQAIKDRLTTSTNAQATAQNSLNVAMDRATRDASHQADVDAQRLTVLQKQGPRALQQYDATTGKSTEDIRTNLQASIDRSGPDLVGLIPEDLMGADSAKISALAYDRYKGTPNAQDKMKAFTTAATTAVRDSNQFGIQATRSNANDYALSQQQNQDQLNKANTDTYGAANDQKRLASAYREGITASREMEVEVAGLAAYRSLDSTATDAQREAALKAAEALTRQTQKTTLARSATDELTKSTFAAADATKLNAAYLEGPAAVARAQRDIATDTSVGRAMEGATSTEVATQSNNLETSAVSAGNNSVYQLNLKADAERKVAAASGVSKQAAYDEAQAQDVLAQVNAMGLTKLSDIIDMTKNLTAARKADDDATLHASNSAALLSTNQSTELMRQETVATLEGVAALERFRIAKAGIEAGQNFVGSGPDRQAAIDAAEVQARQQILVERAHELADAFKQPILAAINDVEQGFQSMFAKIMEGGINNFHMLAHEVEDTLRKMLADFVSQRVTDVFKQKLTDVYHQQTGMVQAPTVSSALNGAASALSTSADDSTPNTGIPVNVSSIGGVAITAMAATAAASGTAAAGGGVGSLLGMTASTLKSALGNTSSAASGDDYGGYGDSVGNANVTYSNGASKMGEASGYAGIAAGGWSVGQEIGKMTTNHAVGAVGGALAGAAEGAAIGSVVPGVGTAIGAGVGALTGAISGFLSVGSMSHDAARALQEGRDAMATALASFSETANMQQSTLVDELRQNETTRQQLVAQANSTLPGLKNQTERQGDIDAANADAAAGKATDISNFFISITQQLQAVLGNSLPATLYNLQLAFENNQRSMAAAGATTAQMSEALQLYNASAAKAINDYNLSVAQEKGGIEVQQLQAQGATYAASQLQMQLDQQQQLNAAIEEWGNTNPEIITQLKEMQAIQTANGSEQIADAQRNAVAGFKVSGYAYQFETFEDQFLQNIQKLYGTVTPPATGFTVPPVNTNPSNATTTYGSFSGTGGIATFGTSPTPAVQPSLTINLPPGAITIDGTKDPVEMATDLVTGLRQIQATKGGGNTNLSDTLNQM